MGNCEVVFTFHKAQGHLDIPKLLPVEFYGQSGSDTDSDPVVVYNST